jgi:ATP-dependent Zn protease
MNLVNEAALLAARRGKRIVTMNEFEDAKDKVMMGAERRTLVMTDDEKRLTAYHEAGHAVVALNVPRPIRSTRPRSSPAAGRSAWSCSSLSATSSPCRSSR